MRLWFWAGVAGLATVVVLLAILAWRGRRRREPHDDLSPDWLVQNSYRRNGDDHQTK